jgi:hypothetical protein
MQRVLCVFSKRKIATNSHLVPIITTNRCNHPRYMNIPKPSQVTTQSQGCIKKMTMISMSDNNSTDSLNMSFVKRQQYRHKNNAKSALLRHQLYVCRITHKTLKFGIVLIWLDDMWHIHCNIELVGTKMLTNSNYKEGTQQPPHHIDRSIRSFKRSPSPEIKSSF